MKKTLLLFTLLSLTGLTIAQPFTPDSDGYIADPRFKALLKSRGYELVGVFDTIQRHVLPEGYGNSYEEPKISYELAARVKKGKEWFFINTSGEVMNDMNSNYGRDMEMQGIPREDRILARNTTNKYKIFTENGKKGLSSLENTPILPPVYEDFLFHPYDSQFLMVKYNGHWGVYGLPEAKMIIAPIYEEITFFEANNPDLTFKVKLCGQKGIVSRFGKEIIAVEYDEVKNHPFKSEVILLTKNRAIGWADRKGNIMVPVAYDEILHHPGDLHAIVKRGREELVKYGIVDLKGNELLPPVYDEVVLKAKIFKIVKNGKIGFFSNRTGQIITEPVYTELSHFMYGMARVKIQDETSTRYGYINDEGVLIFRVIYEYADEQFYKEFAVVKQNEKYGLLNVRGTFIIEPAYEYLKIIIPESETSVQDPSRLIFSKYGMYGVMDFSGKVLLNPVYDLIQPVKRLFLVKKSGLSGVISEKGKVYLPIIYPALKVFDAGIYTIQKDGKEYLIDFYGNKQLKD